MEKMATTLSELLHPKTTTEDVQRTLKSFRNADIRHVFNGNKTLSQLRLIARHHTFPRIFIESLIQQISSSESDIIIKIFQVQVLKYVIKLSPDEVSFEQIIELLHKNYPTNDKDGLESLMSELCFALCNTKFTGSYDLRKLLDLKNLNHAARQAVSKYIEIHSENTAEFQIDLNNATTDEPWEGNDNISKYLKASNVMLGFQGGLSHIKKDPTHSSKPNAVKVQTQNTIQSQETNSEKNDLETINLARTLNSRSRQIGKVQAKEVEPAESKGGSDTSWYRNTYYQVLNLRDLAKTKKTISKDDIKYLSDKLTGSHMMTFSYRSTTEKLILEAFYYISCRQNIANTYFLNILKKLDNPHDADDCENILNTVLNCIVRNPDFIKQNLLNALNTFKRHKLCNSKMEILIFDIFVETTVKSSETNVDVFNTMMDMFLNSFSTTEQMDTAIRCINVQSLSSEKSKVLFTKEVISKLIGFIQNSSEKEQQKMNVVEVVENFLDHQETGNLTTNDLKMLGQIICNENNKNLTFMLVRCVLKSVRKGQTPDTNLLKNLIECTANFENDVKLIGMILVSINEFSKTIPISNIDKLVAFLDKDEEISEAILLGLDDVDDDIKISISDLCATIILTCVQNENATNLSNESFERIVANCLKSLENRTERKKQTRILASEIIYRVSDLIELDQLHVEYLFSFVEDEASDVKIYARAGYVKAMKSLCEKCEDTLPTKFIDNCTTLWTNNPVVHDGKEFSTEINGSIIDVLDTECNKQNVLLSKITQTFLATLISNESKFLSNCLEMIECLTENAVDNNSQIALIDNLVNALEIVLVSCRPKQEIATAENIFMNLIRMGRTVSNIVLQWFCDILKGTEDDDVYEQTKEVLDKANMNQDLTDFVFYDLYMENILSFLKTIKEADEVEVGEDNEDEVDEDEDNEDDENEDDENEDDENEYDENEDDDTDHDEEENENVERVLKKLEFLLKDGFKLSHKGMTILGNLVLIENVRENVIICLSQASENGQNISKDIIEAVNSIIINDNFENVENLLSLCYQLVKNNQMLDDKVPHLFCEMYISCRDSNILKFLILLSKKAIRFSNEQLEQLGNEIIVTLINGNNRDNVEVVNFLPDFLSIFVSAAKNCICNNDEEIYYTLLPIFFHVIQSDLENLLSLAIDGLLNLLNAFSNIELSSEYKSVLVNSLTRFKHNETFCKTVNSILGFQKLTTEQEKVLKIMNISELADDVFLNELNSLDISFEYLNINPHAISKLFRLIESSENENFNLEMALHVLYGYLKDFAEVTENIPLNFLEKIVELYIVNDDKEIKSKCMDIIILPIWTQSDDNDLFWNDNVLQRIEQNYKSCKEILLSNKTLQLKLNEQIRFYLEFEKVVELKSVQEVHFWLDNILKKLYNGLKLNEDCVEIITKFARQFPNVSLLFAEVITNAIVKNQCKMVREHMNIVCVAIELIDDDSDVSLNLLQTYYECLKASQNSEEIQERSFPKSLLKIFKRTTSFAVKECVLTCFMEMTKKKVELEDEVFWLIFGNLQSKECQIRKIAFSTLRNSSDLNDERKRIFNKFVENFTMGLLADVEEDSEFEIFLKNCHDKSQQNLGPVELFVMQTIIGLKFSDFKVLSEISFEYWNREMMIADLIFHICENATEAERLFLLDTLRLLQNQIGNIEEHFLKCLEWLGRLWEFKGWNGYEMGAFIKLIKFFSATEIEIYSQMKLTAVESNVQQKILELKLQEKLKCNEKKQMVKQFEHCSQQLVSSIGFIYSNFILQKLESIETLQELNKLTVLINKHQLKLEVLKECGNLKNVNSFRTFAETSIIFQKIEQLKLQAKMKLNLKTIVACFCDRSDETGFPFLIKIFQLKENFNSIESKTLYHILSLLSNHSLSVRVMDDILESIINLESNLWLEKTNDKLISLLFNNGLGLKSVEDVVEDLANLLEFTEKEWKQKLIFDIKTVQSGELMSVHLDSENQIKNWEKYEIYSWSTAVTESFASNNNQIDHEFSIEALAVAKVAFKIFKTFELTPVQIVSIYMGLNKGLKGQLMQVSTGSGKSTIVAILAVINALRGLTVDVYTSSPVLAERDSKSWSEFYNMFGLSVSHNGDSGVYISGLKNCYKTNIVYGEISQFQFDILRQKYSDLGAMGERTQQCAIIDEVDSSLVDDLTKLARLSTGIPGMDLIQMLYHLCWNRMNAIEQKLFSFKSDIYFVEGNVKYVDGIAGLEFADDDGEIKFIGDLVGYIQLGQDLNKAKIHHVDNLEEFISDHLTDFLKASIGEHIDGFSTANADAVVKVPKHLKKFVISQIPRWVENCITAYNYEENVHYVVHEGQIKPVDYLTTGIIQNSTAWGDGLHQFLQIKHKLKLTSETMTTNFLSNMALFRMYIKTYSAGKLKEKNKINVSTLFESKACEIIGFTGTLGSECTRKMLGDIFNVNCVNIPLTHFKKYVQYPDKILSNDEELWIWSIVSGVDLEIKRKRGVLIICETIKDASKIAKAIKSSKIGYSGLKLYTQNGSDQERNIEVINKGMIFIATNLAGRGTDINTKEIEKCGGLHVLLTFLPNNTRVEEQAFGRTSRQGNYGSGQLIAIPSLEIAVELMEYPRRKARLIRNARDDRMLMQFLKTDLPLVSAKDECFSKFCNFLIRIRFELRKERKSLKKVTDFVGITNQVTASEMYTLQAIEERWAMFLKQLDKNQNATECQNCIKNDTDVCDECEKTKGIPPRLASGYYMCFQRRLLSNFKSDDHHTKVFSSPYYHISLGNDYLLKDSKWSHTLEDARRHFTAALALDADVSVGAYVGLGNILMKGNEGIVWDGYENNYKTNAISYFNKAVGILQNEIASLVAIQSFVNNNDCDLAKQISMKMTMLGSYIKCLESSIDVAKCSLRTIDIVGHKKQQRHAVVPYFYEGNTKLSFNDNVVASTNKNITYLGGPLKYDHVTLSFSNLTVSQDSGAKDQAIKTVKSVKSKVNFQLECPTVSYDTLLSLLSKDTYVFGVSTNGAIEIIKEWHKKHTPKIPIPNWKPNKLVDIKQILASTQGDPEKIVTVCEKKIFKDAEKVVEKYPEDLHFELVCQNENSKVYDIIKNVDIDLEVTNLDKGKVGKLIKCLDFESVSLKCSKKTLQIAYSQLTTLEENIVFRKNIVQNNLNIICNDTLDGIVKEKDDLDVEIEVPSNHKEQLIKLCEGTTNNEKFSLVFRKIIKDSFKAVDKRELKNALSNSGLSVTFSKLDSDKCVNVINLLRENNVNFLLKVHHVDISDALEIVKNAIVTQENIEMRGVKLLSDLYTKEFAPTMELAEFAARGIYVMFDFSEKQFIPWFSVGCVLLLAGAQMVLGAVLITTGFGATVGMGLITEGAADIFTAFRAVRNRQFNWTDYAKQKAVSLTISAVSMGFSKLKDAGKGISNIAEAVSKEALEQAGGKMVQKGVTLTTTIAITGDNLKTLAMQQVVVGVGEAAVRETLNFAVDLGVQYAMSCIEDSIKSKLENLVLRGFGQDEFTKYCALVWALDKSKLDEIIKGAIGEVTNPSSNYWTQQWSSVGLPLCRGVLSDSKFLGNKFVWGMRIITILNGMHEIVTVIDMVMETILVRLKQQVSSVVSLIHFNLGFSLGESQTVAQSVVKTQDKSGKLFYYETSDPEENVRDFFKKLNSKMAKFEIKDVSDSMQIVISDVSKHISETAKTQMVAPISTWGVGVATTGLSEWVQANYIVRSDNNAPGQEGKTYNTVKEQINANAEAYCVAYQQRDIILKIDQAKLNNDKGQDSNSKSESIKSGLLGVATDGPADMITMFTMAKIIGIDVKIVDDSYIPTQEDIDSGVKLVVYKESESKDQIGHYQIMDSKTGNVINVPQQNMNDCGFSVMSHLSEGKFSEQDLRSGVVNSALSDVDSFSKVMDNKNWICDRYPTAATFYLKVGGREVLKDWMDPINVPPPVERAKTKINQNGHIKMVDGEKVMIQNYQADIPFEAEHGTRPNESTEAADGNIKGHVVSQRLGGTGDASNIMYQTPSSNLCYYHDVEKPVIQFKQDAASAGWEGSLKMDISLVSPVNSDIVKPNQAEIKLQLSNNASEQAKESFRNFMINSKYTENPTRSGIFTQTFNKFGKTN